MPYSLSFSEEFYQKEGDDRLTPSCDFEPTTVYRALLKLSDEQWAEIAKEVFGLDDPDYLTAETVLEKIRQTNTCGTLSPPVDVWIDSEGWYSVDVYEEKED